MLLLVGNNRLRLAILATSLDAVFFEPGKNIRLLQVRLFLIVDVLSELAIVLVKADRRILIDVEVCHSHAVVAVVGVVHTLDRHHINGIVLRLDSLGEGGILWRKLAAGLASAGIELDKPRCVLV